MKRGNEISMCLDCLIMTVLAFILLCLALKDKWIPLELYVPMVVADAIVALYTIYKLQNIL